MINPEDMRIIYLGRRLVGLKKGEAEAVCHQEEIEFRFILPGVPKNDDWVRDRFNLHIQGGIVVEVTFG